MVTEPGRERNGTLAINQGSEKSVNTFSQPKFGAMITLGHIMTYFDILYVICLTFQMNL